MNIKITGLENPKIESFKQERPFYAGAKETNIITITYDVEANTFISLSYENVRKKIYGPVYADKSMYNENINKRVATFYLTNDAILVPGELQITIYLNKSNSEGIVQKRYCVGKILNTVESTSFAGPNIIITKEDDPSEIITDFNDKMEQINSKMDFLNSSFETYEDRLTEHIELIDSKADKSTTYTKSETYSKTETNTLLNDKADKSTTYTKGDVDLIEQTIMANTADEFNNRFGQWSFSEDIESGARYLFCADDCLLSNFDESIGFGTVLGNEDHEVLLQGSGSRPKYSTGGDAKDIALLDDVNAVGSKVDTIQSYIPNQANSSNQLADKDFVNSSIATNTATFRGTYTNPANFPTTGVDENDYIFYSYIDTQGNTIYQRHKYTNGEWVFEYELNNSGFTAAQWAAINSNATQENISQITKNQNNIMSIEANKANKSDVYSKEETDALLDEVASGGADLTNYYTKTETETRIAEKLDEKQITECNCSHENEITGFGEEDCNLVIDDQDVVISKIQGQTRRKSMNLWDEQLEKGSLGNNGEKVDNAMVIRSINFINVKPNTIYTINANSDVWAYDSQQNSIELLPFTNGYTFTTPSNCYYLRFRLSTDYGTTYKNDVMLNEGSTALPYEPYDNTLVNSKCDFVSTGRNLLPNSHNIIITGGEYVLISNLKPNTTYTISNTSSLGEWIILLDDNSSFGGWTTKQPITFKTQATTNNIRYYFNTSNDDVKIMLNYGDTALPYEPYVEDTMQCGIELGAFDYHDNVNHITHRQTSEMITLNGSENWVLYNNNMFTNVIDSLAKDNGKSTSNSNYETYIGNGNTKLAFITNGAYTVDTWKSYLQANPIQLVYELPTETTEENILPSGYKVWYKGMQVQKTDTLPYILTKQYAISLASQVLNNVSIDRNQQKQIDELKENKLNSTTSDGYNVESLLKLLSDNVKKTINRTVSATTGNKGIVVESGTVFNASGTLTILPNSTNKKISNLTIANGTGTVNSNVSYNSSTGVISFTLQGSTASTDIYATISYDITINQYLENQTRILSEESLEE